jgi:hypothetical protein
VNKNLTLEIDGTRISFQFDSHDNGPEVIQLLFLGLKGKLETVNEHLVTAQAALGEMKNDRDRLRDELMLARTEIDRLSTQLKETESSRRYHLNESVALRSALNGILDFSINKQSSRTRKNDLLIELKQMATKAIR